MAKWNVDVRIDVLVGELHDSSVEPSWADAEVYDKALNITANHLDILLPFSEGEQGRRVARIGEPSPIEQPREVSPATQGFVYEERDSKGLNWSRTAYQGRPAVVLSNGRSIHVQATVSAETAEAAEEIVTSAAKLVTGQKSINRDTSNFSSFPEHRRPRYMEYYAHVETGTASPVESTSESALAKSHEPAKRAAERGTGVPIAGASTAR